ncbi:MAG: hypothetical protein ACI4JQ_08790 [Ruminococcus sp.]
MVLFFISILISVFASVVFLQELCPKKAERKYPRVWKVLQICARTASVLMLVLALLALLDIADFGAFHSAYSLMAALCFMEWAFCQLWHMRPSAWIRFAAKTLFTVLILELTLFNMPTYRLCLGDYPQTSLSVADAQLEGNGTRNDNGTITISGDTEMILTFEGVNQQVGTIHTAVSFAEGAKEALLKIDVMDETQSNEYRYDIINKKIVNQRESSEMTACEFSGNVDKLRVKLTPIGDTALTLEAVTVNQTIPFQTSIVRVLLLLIIPIFIYTVMKSSVMQKTVEENGKFCRITAILITAGFCLIAFSAINYKMGDGGWSEQFRLESGNQMTQELVDAFEAGQVHLLEEPSADLSTLKNPYDCNAREASGAFVLWDHVYYNNHYYSYYGIAPVILLFLPYHMLTGYYFSDVMAVLLFSIMGMIGLTMVFLTFVKKWFPKIPAGIMLTCLILLQIVSGIWFSVGRPDFYESAISAGFACLTWGTYFLLRANILGSGKISCWRTAAASLLLALAVLCRPTLAVYCICAAIFLLMAIPRFKKDGEMYQSGRFAKNGTRYLICAFLPMLCLAGVQMWYNTARFGSPMDFGIQYSLTINDFTKSQFHFQFVWMALFNYLFNTPIFSAEYPFIHTEFQDMQTGGFFYIDCPATSNTSGLFFLALPVFAYFLAGKAWKQLPGRTEKLQSLAYIGLPCVIMPLIIIASVWESGYAVRYMLDFSWLAVLGAFAILFFLYQKTKQPIIQQILKGFLCFSMVWALTVSGLQSANQIFRYADSHYDYPEIAYSIEQMIAFWK